MAARGLQSGQGAQGRSAKTVSYLVVPPRPSLPYSPSMPPDLASAFFFKSTHSCHRTRRLSKLLSMLDNLHLPPLWIGPSHIRGSSWSPQTEPGARVSRVTLAGGGGWPSYAIWDPFVHCLEASKKGDTSFGCKKICDLTVGRTSYATGRTVSASPFSSLQFTSTGKTR